MKFILLSIAFYLKIHLLLADTYSLNIYFKFDDRKVFDFSESEKYIQFNASANWEDSKGDYGVMYCLGHMYSSKTAGTDFKGYCNAENQDNDKFWLNFSRKSDDMDVGVGSSKFIKGTGRYKEFVGISCPYAVKFFKDRTFFKKKCNLN